MQTLQQIIDASRRLVFFGGAGVSTESGIPDFRSAKGLFSQTGDEELTPEMILSQSFFYLHPERFYAYYRQNLLHPNALPNEAHKKLYELEKCGKLRGIVTQNIDGLHRKAGNRLVYELHGNIYENACMECGEEYPLSYIMECEGVPRCFKCGSVIKPGIVLYGEAPDKYSCMGACREISNCDTLIVAGTSLEVEPAASFLGYFRGRELVLINREKIRKPKKTTLFIRESIARVFSEIKL